jgi:hypothetical protein
MQLLHLPLRLLHRQQLLLPHSRLLQLRQLLAVLRPQALQLCRQHRHILLPLTQLLQRVAEGAAGGL